MVPRWKKKLDTAKAAAEKIADAERCSKTVLTRVSYGEFAEMNEHHRCLLDREHFGDCIANPKKVEDLKDEPHPDSAMDVLVAAKRPFQT